MGNPTKKALDATHGLKFEQKLLMLFCVRALGAGYKFELSREREDVGGKFNDVVFRYQVPDKTPEDKAWRYRYLQAKHKLDESYKIKSTQLLEDNDNDFSIPKYFRSFCIMTTRNEIIHDCILCTNSDFHLKDAQEYDVWINNKNKKVVKLKNGIELLKVNDEPEDILEFGPQQNTCRYKLNFTQELRDKALNDWQNIQLLAKQLQVFAQNGKKIETRIDVFKNYHVALINERVIDLKTKKFHEDFVNEAVSLSNGAKELRQILCELVGNDDWKTWKFQLNNTFGRSQPAAETENRLPLKIGEADIKAFFDKFLFVVNMPNEEHFEDILQTNDVSKYYTRKECKEQTLVLLNVIPDSLKKAMKMGRWLTSEEAKEILLEGVKKISIEYQTQLGNEVGFNEEAKKTMANELQKMLKSNNTIERITTLSPRHTAVKVISAIPELQQKHAASISHLVISSSQLQSKEDAERWKNVFQLPNDSGHSLLVVCDDGEQPFQDDHVAQMDEGEKTKRHKVIVISRKQPAIAAHINDEIKFSQLDESFKQKTLSKIVSFQGENEKVGRLVGPKPEDVLDSLEELLRPEVGQIIIPSFDSTGFVKSLYIKRRVKFAFHDRFIADLAKRLECSEEKLNGECRISAQGQIEWFVDDDRRKKIWENITQMNDQTPGKIEEDSHLIQFDKERNQHPVDIICGVAGTGKSTLLSHYYTEIKKMKPDCWVIRLNLVEHCDAILKLDRSKPDLIGFLINHLHVVDSKCPFSCSLLNHRFETGEQIVFMFDGYDEIDEECQDIAVQLIKIIQKKGIQLYVTTRSHKALQLQYELGQLAYNLENFNKEYQIDYLTSYWTQRLPNGVQAEAIKKFAELLVNRVSETLKDDERAFIGIPLQCRILAECYQQKIGDIVQNNNRQSDKLLSQKLLALLDDQKFDLVSLYSQLMVTKRDIFLQEKSQAGSNPNVEFAMRSTIKKIDLRLTKLAVETIVTEPNILEMLWPAKISHKSSDDVAQEKSILAKNTLKFGLTFSNEDGMRPQFLHRTFAEYLVAKYLYEGFHPNDNRHNKLLENESIRKLILNKILASKEYDGVQVFFDGMVKTMVDEDKEWRKKINDRELPDRLTKMMTDGSSELQPSFKNAVHFSILNGKGNIFRLFCDCLDATFERSEVSQFVRGTLFGPVNRFSSNALFEESKFFKRFINYFDIINPDDFDTSSTIKHLLEHMFPHSFLWLKKNLDGHPETMNELLEFLEKQNVAFDKCLLKSSEDDLIENALLYLICHDKYRSHLKRFLALVSKSTAYSDDFKFAKFLIKVFQSEKQLMTGRIAETLTILDGLDRSSLLVQLYGEVLSIDPEAFQNIYQPCRLEKDDAIPTDFDILMKKDFYDMTLLHRAAFYGDVNIVGQILARFRQRELDDGTKQELRKVVLEGYTPFYFATAKNQKKVCSKLLAFVKDICPNAPTGELTELNVNIHQSFYLAVKSKNAKMFQLTMNVVKTELGHDYLLTQLIANFAFSGISIFDRCYPNKLFNAMVNIIVDRDGVEDYKCLHDLIFNTERIATNALRRMDAEHLQRLLSIEGAGPFTERLLKNNLYPNFYLLSSYLLKNFDEKQLLDFVETITLQGDTKIVKSSQSVTVSTVRLSDPTYRDETIQHHPRDYAPNDLVFTPNDDGTTTVHAERVEPRNSIWGDFLRSTATSLVGGQLGVTQVETILKCLTCVSDKLGGNSAKELWLHQDNYGYVVLHLSQEIVTLMLKRLPEKSQEEIKMEWKENGPPMTHDTFINHDSVTEFSSSAIALHYSDILRFYLDYGSEMQLSRCVDILTSVRWIGRQQRSVWSYIVEHCEVTTTNEILKSVSKVFGWEAVEKLLLHEMDGSPVLLKAASWGHDIDGLLDILPQEIRKDVQQVIQEKAADFIEEVLLHPRTYFNELEDRRYKARTLFNFLIDYSKGKQREQFVQNIVTIVTL
ncbi:uncharacterized protein LOC130694018 [Daphnia carinata]|uniref:uncharacterized protein LOC130694018 n=1 Tax=Daphnia carinata TaxID=120202 RepID=UPI002580ED8C|nr:uncharacterized protein LOC130694018 [Daphnia carinata]XP_057373137.1 uncharacterized protein LOC130694018 [Daphnia carinata]